MTATPAPEPRSRLLPYLRMARVDHWFKNAFMLLGVLLAFFYDPALFAPGSAGRLGLALLATCLVASSNYVINELLDAPLDRLHPGKRTRPAARGEVRPALVVLGWLILGALGVAVAFSLNRAFGLSATGLWGMGLVYNMPPLRTKEIPYVDVQDDRTRRVGAIHHG